LIHPLGELEEAERLCDEALELAESDDERVDALLLKFDALLGQDHVAQAKSLCERFPEGPYDNPAHTFLVGRALYEIGDLERAAPLIEAASELSPPNADSFYYLGLLRDEQGKPQAATSAFLRSRQLEVDAPRAAWALDPERVHELAQQALEALPENLRGRLSPDHVFVADLPGVEVIVEGVDPRALLLLDAPPPGHAEEAPNRLFVYQRNLERTASEPEALLEELSAALQRELTNAFIDPAS
jgi:tetratricopeptide (TPR) repeat protein